MKKHVVRQGECLSTIAKQYGFRDYRVLYDHIANAELKRLRPNPNLIYPGDTVVLPDKAVKSAAADTTAVHRYRLTSRRKILRIKLQDAHGELLSEHGYCLTWSPSGQPIEGTSDAEGLLEQRVPDGVSGAVLAVAGEEQPRHLRFQHLNPLHDTADEGISGVQARLMNLGYDPGPIDGKLGKWTRSAAALFARDVGLTSEDPQTPAFLAALQKAHGC